MTHARGRRLGAALLGAVAGLALLGASSALAATATVDGSGTLVYTAAAGVVNDVTFTQTGTTTTVDVLRNGSDADPIVPSGSCTTTSPTDITCTGVARVSADGADKNDSLDASGLNTLPATLNGGDDNDTLLGSPVNDTLNGGNGNDGLAGAAGNDSVNAGAGDDFVFGDAGNDTLNGDDGNDYLDGGADTDTVNGGAGDDTLNEDYRSGTNAAPGDAFPSDNNDTFNGGDGYDQFTISAQSVDENNTPTTTDDVYSSPAVSVTLDDNANDGVGGENANVKSDVESVQVSNVQVGPSGNLVPGGASNTLTGDSGINQLVGNAGNETIDGGAGNDILNGNGGNDTINARDGYADFVTCGTGNDTANVDSLDTVASDCETVNRVNVGNANEDRPPTIAITSPADNATIATKSPTAITANVADDKGISAVLYTVNGRLVCAATVAPYTCSYQPVGSDVGRTAIVALAVDTSQQTATAIKTVNIGLFAPKKLSASVTPTRDRKAPFRFTTKGTLTLPTTVTKLAGCKEGVVSVQVKVGSRTVSTRRANITKSCTYSSTVVFHNRKRFGRATKLKFVARFGGNKVLDRSITASKSVSIR